MFNIVHLYAKEMNIYGDNGNVLVIRKRLERRGIPCTVINVGIGDEVPGDAHLIIGGGGQDSGQIKVADDLQEKALLLHELADSNVPMFMVCGMYQLFGDYFLTAEDNKILGIGILRAHTIAQSSRIIGNVGCHTKWGVLAGYENHSGRTFLKDQNQAFGAVPKGSGNNGEDLTEGAVYKNVFGTYMHGPLLAKSPSFADYLIGLGLKVANMRSDLKQLDDSLAKKATSDALMRPR
jgi:CobQ-like glutamine amidotransferase family enzyme